MNRTKFCYILIIIIGLINIYLSISKRDPSIPNVQEIVRDSLIRDSIYIVNDSIVEKIKYIDKEYDEKVYTIMSSSDSINFYFFVEYIKNYNMKLELLTLK